jgi:F-type H+-transporting ATPase subunit delta
MRTSKQARRSAKTLFRSCCVDGLLDEDRARTVVQRVLEVKPRGFMAILQHFKRLVKLDLDRRSARIENAVESSDALMSSIRANLATRYGPGLDVTFRVNPELIAGLRVKVGSDVYDGSVKARLDELAGTF